MRKVEFSFVPTKSLVVSLCCSLLETTLFYLRRCFKYTNLNVFLTASFSPSLVSKVIAIALPKCRPACVISKYHQHTVWVNTGMQETTVKTSQFLNGITFKYYESITYYKFTCSPQLTNILKKDMNQKDFSGFMFVDFQI